MSTIINSENNKIGKKWIRGVNLGGWLVMERYITPYQFAVTDCHVRGDFCWYPGQLSAPSPHDPKYKLCDLKKCSVVRVANAFGNKDYPVDEKTLAEAFLNSNNQNNISSATVGSSSDAAVASKEVAEQWFNYHFENFIQMADLAALKEVGVTHLRVPIPHWIMGDVEPYEMWIVGKRWESFVRVCKWARQLGGLVVWPDVHTAPGSQNGFDNSGEALPYTTCQVWSNNPEYVDRSLRAIQAIAQGIVDAEIQDVVTGFGLLNEPYADCIQENYRDFIQAGLGIVRETLGPDTAVYVSDMFQANLFNDGHWWLDPRTHSNTFLDSHYYQVFDQPTRGLSPRQHIAYTCENHFRRTTSCCYQDATTPVRGRSSNKKPSEGVSRMIGEWSASFDILPSARINEIMEGIAATGTAPYFDRQLSPERKEFLRDYVQAQIVTFEAADVGTSSAWFYWTLKTEGGAFAEWSFLRGVDEGWFPAIPADTSQSSQSLFGSCLEILFRTSDNSTAIVQEFPDPAYLPPVTDPHKIIDDDVVLSHGESLLHPNNDNNQSFHNQRRVFFWHHWLLFGAVLVALGIVVRKCKNSRKRAKYSQLDIEVSAAV